MSLIKGNFLTFSARRLRHETFETMYKDTKGSGTSVSST
jgi:hypothetical protein